MWSFGGMPAGPHNEKRPLLFHLIQSEIKEPGDIYKDEL
jgi:hypothetical protein